MKVRVWVGCYPQTLPPLSQRTCPIAEDPVNLSYLKDSERLQQTQNSMTSQGSLTIGQDAHSSCPSVLETVKTKIGEFCCVWMSLNPKGSINSSLRDFTSYVMLYTFISSKVLNCWCKEMLISISWNILEETISKRSEWPIFLNNLTCSTCTPSDRMDRSVRIVFRIHAWLTFEVNILAKDLTIIEALANLFSCHDKFTLTVWYWDSDVSNFYPASHGEFVLAIRVSTILATLVSIIRRGLDSCYLHLQSYRMEEDLIDKSFQLQIPIIKTTTFDEAIDSCTYFFIEQDVHDEFSWSIRSVGCWEAMFKKKIILAFRYCQPWCQQTWTIALSLSVTNGTKLTSHLLFSLSWIVLRVKYLGTLTNHWC